MYLKVSPMKGVQRFGVKRKLAPRYVGLFQIIEQKGEVADKLQVPPEMSAIFNVFHVSQLKRCVCIPEEAIAPTNIKLQSDLIYEEKTNPSVRTNGKSNPEQSHSILQGGVE